MVFAIRGPDQGIRVLRRKGLLVLGIGRCAVACLIFGFWSSYFGCSWGSAIELILDLVLLLPLSVKSKLNGKKVTLDNFDGVRGTKLERFLLQSNLIPDAIVMFGIVLQQGCCVQGLRFLKKQAW